MAVENPDLDPVALTKLVAARWYNDTEDTEEKREFKEEAKLDKERFNTEVRLYKEDHPDYEPTNKGKKKKKNDENEDDKLEKKKDGSTSCKKDPMKKSELSTHNNNELPIFTDTFLSHNLQIETELKQLRKQSTETEIQNDFLQKFVENMQGAVTKIQGEITAEKQFNTNLQVYLTKLKCNLASHFNQFPLANFKGASVENIEDFLKQLTDPGTPQSSLNKAKDVIKKTDIKI